MTQRISPLQPPTLEAPTHDPFSGRALYQPDAARIAGAFSPARVGNQRDLKINSGQTSIDLSTVAEFRSPDGMPRILGVNAGVLIPPTDISCAIEWYVQWGHGGSLFSGCFLGAFRSFTLVGDYARLSARLVQLSSGTGASVRVTGHVTALPGGFIGGRLTQWNVNYAMAKAPNLIGFPQNQALTDITQDSYVLEGDTNGLRQFAGVVRRIDVTRSDTGTSPDYIMLFDATPIAAGPPYTVPGAQPIKMIGAVVGGGTISWDAGEDDGIQFFSGLILGASSTGGTYTRDAAAILAVDWQVDLGNR